MRTEINYDYVLNNPIPLKVMLNTLPTKGNLVYEYNPFRNYRLTSNKYWYKENYYTKEELEEKYNIFWCFSKGDPPNYYIWTEFSIKENGEYNKDTEGNLIRNPKPTKWCELIDAEYSPVDPQPELYEKGLLVDFVTEDLKFSLKNPVHIVPLYSYDGSVNLILNDGLNIPRLINSRFSATGKNTYEIVDRKGSNDTNIYDLGELFDIDTSLYKIVNKIPKVKFLGTPSGGNLKVGNYHFYFKLADSDGNETDFVAESGLVSVFIGNNSYSSVYTGNKNENSTKLVEFRLEDIDSAYDYIQVYYSRYTAENGENSVYEYKKINKKYSRVSPRIIITGFEETEDIAVTDLNLFYNLVDSVKTSAVCLNMLFMGNVKKQNIPYEELLDLSLRILPILETENYILPDENYLNGNTKNSYIDPQFIYNKTGYWENELYRFGIVYIMPNGLLTPVFNIRGGINIKKESKFLDIPVLNEENEREYVNYNENNFLIIHDSENYYPNDGTIVEYENTKGVCSFKHPESQNCLILHPQFYISPTVKKELKKYIKGFFFVRLSRIPTVLAQGITIGIDNESRTPTIPTAGGILSNLAKLLESTHVETKNINGLNYISEGFLKRYSFTFKKKSSSLWNKFGDILGTAAILTAAVVASVYLGPIGGAAIVEIGGALVGLSSASAVVGAAVAAGAVAVAAATAVTGVVTAAIATGQDVYQHLVRFGSVKELKGKATKAPDGYKIVETDDSRLLTKSFDDRIIIKDSTKNKVLAIICPDYTINQAYYNLIFTGNEHIIKTDNNQCATFEESSGESYFDSNGRHFYILKYNYTPFLNLAKVKILGIPDNVKALGFDDLIFRSRAGEAEESWRYSQIGNNYEESDSKKINTDIIRGSFGPYLACNNDVIGPAKIINIYVSGYDESQIQNYIEIRMNDNSVYNAITDRIDINNTDSTLLNDLNNGCKIDGYRGDCYICLFTLRINRNFNDLNAPYNDEIVDKKTWKDNYNPDKPEDYSKINVGDLNAIPLGMWVTFLLRSSNNLNIRSLDTSNVDETAMTGHSRGYFPAQPMSVEGLYKTPESLIYNKGFAKSLSEKWNMHSPDVPHIKNWFGTRIMYSDIHINDGYKNGFRVFQGTNYRDYTREYGEIVKLVPFESSLLCVFEHGIALIPVNERSVAGQGAGGSVYINTSNVLPENPRIISDMFGSLWPESILKVPGKTGNAALYVYGVDTVAKKIWRTDGNSLLCISDFKVQEFLNNNITLGERELTPIIGVRNVKTVYNAFKRDVMFTFYDNTYGFEEKVWNLCWNEILEKFITFYSWVPSYMENINNIPFSFDRNTSKWIAKLGISHAESSFADGITLSNVVIEDANWEAVLALRNRTVPDNYEYEVKYELVPDLYGNHKYFTIPENTATIQFNKDKTLTDLYSELYYRNKAGNAYADSEENKIWYGSPLPLPESQQDLPPAQKSYGISGVLDFPIFKDKTGKRLTLEKREDMLNPDKIVILLNIKATINIISQENTSLSEHYYNTKAKYEAGTSLIDAGYYESVVAVIPKWNMQFLSTDFWKHGQAGIIDIADDIKPTYWYGKQHPFEFEVVVVNDPAVHKIFDNLELVANKAKPESFHYEIIGECYDFAKDKVNMYFRLEALKALWLYNGADITYNRNFLKVQTRQLAKSADLPHKYYTRIDTINEIEDAYDDITLPNNTRYSYKHLSGAEIVYYPNRLEYRIWQHTPAVDIADLSLDDSRSIITANCQYLEDRWKVTINPILVCYKNEYVGKIQPENSTWAKDFSGNGLLPPLNIYNSPIPDLVLEQKSIKLPGVRDENGIIRGKDNALYELYDVEGFGDGTWSPLDTSNWLNDIGIYGTSFGEALNRKELDLKDRFIKIRIRYSGDELAIISLLNTIYRVSYS